MKYVAFIFLCCFIKISAQDLKNHQWKNRVLLIYADDKNSEKLQQQLEILSKEKEGLSERKLLIQSYTEKEYKTEFSGKWITSGLVYKIYPNSKNDFYVYLIGLDGSIKHEQAEILSTEKLFTIIDGMPMRKRELKQKN